MRLAFFLLVFCLSLWAREFSVASYNAENFFDLVYDGDEYKEYIPNTKSEWNEKTFGSKLSNIAKVINELDADILALQEVENRNAASLLNKKLLKPYPYIYVTDFTRATQLAVFSRFPFVQKKSIVIENFPRNILHVKLYVDSYKLSLFVNHWPAKHHKNEKRVAFAQKLEQSTKADEESILLGDFNAPLYKKKDSWGESLELLTSKFKNLWYELPVKERYSHGFFYAKRAIDHIFLSRTLLDGKGIEYKASSFDVFRPKYLIDKKGNPLRWQISEKGRGKHLGLGFSDHFPLVARFQTSDYTKLEYKQKSIKELLKISDGKVNILLKSIFVQSKNKYGFFIKDSSGASTYLYKPELHLELGKRYDLFVKNIATYKGKREITLCDFAE